MKKKISLIILLMILTIAVDAIYTKKQSKSTIRAYGHNITEQHEISKITAPPKSTIEVKEPFLILTTDNIKTTKQWLDNIKKFEQEKQQEYYKQNIIATIIPFNLLYTPTIYSIWKTENTSNNHYIYIIFIGATIAAGVFLTRKKIDTTDKLDGIIIPKIHLSHNDKCEKIRDIIISMEAKTILITSPSTEEGKTYIAHNLITHFEKATKTILIDLNKNPQNQYSTTPEKINDHFLFVGQTPELKIHGWRNNISWLISNHKMSIIDSSLEKALSIIDKMDIIMIVINNNTTHKSILETLNMLRIYNKESIIVINTK